jgi:hypothetical protein
MPITGIYTKDFPDLGRDAGATDLIPIAEVGNIVTKKTPVSGLITNARVVGALGFTPYNATNPAGYITSASLAPLEFNTTEKTVWNNGKGNVETNTSFGEFALSSNTSGLLNTAYGFNSLQAITDGNTSTAIGAASLKNCSGSGNTAIGYNAGALTDAPAFNNNLTGSYSVFIGAQSKALDDAQTNQIVIGSQAIGLGSNTATLGNTTITITRLRGEVRGGSFVKDGGTSSQFLKADGSVDSNSYLPLSGGTLASSGSSNTLNINHTSGSGIALNILKDGNGEGLTIVKGSGSGNAASITGGITLLSELNLTTKLADAHINSAAVWNAKIGGSGTTNFLAKFTASGVVGNSQIFDNGTNVGIGTTSPVEKLTIRGAAGVSIRLNESSTGTEKRLILKQTESEVQYQAFFASGGNSHSFLTGNSPRLRITSDGNVGINTTSPTSKLQVVGLPEYATNAAAITGGLTVGAFYHTAGVLKVVI